MAVRKQRDIFLATCLLESIEDENYRNTRKLLVEHQANPNLVIPESNIAPIHYAAGMENTAFAEAAMKLILKCNGNPNVQTIEGETPLHIAVIWNRTLIVEMLLDHGADILITDNDKNTPINHAITEKHYNLIPIFQNHVFEKKLQKRMETEAPNSPSQQTPSNVMDKLAKSFKHLELPKNPSIEKFLTPNRTNFNFNEVSPFLVNINQRPRHKRFEEVKTDADQNHVKRAISVDEMINKDANKPKKLDKAESKEADEIIEISDSDDSDAGRGETKSLVKNLFELTKENIEKHLTMVTKKNRKDSLISSWRNKVNESRLRHSILPVNEEEFEAFISENTEETESQSMGSSQQSIETIVQVKPKNVQQESEADESFMTAAEEVGGTFVVEKTLTPKTHGIIDSNEKSEIILQTQEVYEHFDPESNIVFYENKLLAKPLNTAPKQMLDNDVVVLNTSSESGTCTDFAVPTDYDTDDLRKELKNYGEVPGPITKGTKRLYLKRLIRYKRRPQQTVKNPKLRCNFSIELQRTMKSDITSLDFIYEYASFERQMVNSFQCGAGKNMREGNFKKSFVYLLIDPRIAENLLAEAQIISPVELWCRFLKSIFYVGKGKSSRPYAHLYDAIKLYNDKNIHVDKMSKYQESLKLDRIIEIWKVNKGVICLPVFHNITPAEAYTREAAIIDCLGVENLTNIKRGDYYGISKSWTMRDRKKLGVLLLYKAMQVFMVEGESQLRPNDIK